MEHAITVREVEPADLPAVRRRNAENVPLVGPLDEERITLFLSDDAVTFLVATAADDDVVGLFVGVVEGVPYGSPNYRWFAERHARFAYVDRIALAPDARGTGLADRLYDDWSAAAAAAGREVVCAEVNVEPPNERSLAFHARRGFVEVDRLSPYGDGGEVVSMLERRL